MGFRVYEPRVPINSIETRAKSLHRFLVRNNLKRVNLIGHSMGGLDCRLLASLDPKRIASLITISTPHHGSAFMDYIADLGLFNKHNAFSNLTSEYLKLFNKNTPNNECTCYYSIGARTYNPPWSLRVPHEIIKLKEGDNDGLVSVQSSHWGKYLGTLDCDHFFTNYDYKNFYLDLGTFLQKNGF